jgi:isocitrate dehydrogenase
MILSAAMMLEFMGWNEAASLIVNAVERTLRQGILTADIAESVKHRRCVGTREFGDAIIAQL